MILCFCWPKVGPGIISEILKYITEALRSSSPVKEEIFGDGSKTQPHGCQDVLPTRQMDFIRETSQSRKARPCPRASDGVLGAEQVRFLDDHLEIYLPLSQRNKPNEKIKNA